MTIKQAVITVVLFTTFFPVIALGFVYGTMKAAFIAGVELWIVFEEYLSTVIRGDDA